MSCSSGTLDLTWREPRGKQFGATHDTVRLGQEQLHGCHGLTLGDGRAFADPNPHVGDEQPLGIRCGLRNGEADPPTGGSGGANPRGDVSRIADGVIVGSATVKAVGASVNPAATAAEFASAFRRALDEGRGV